MRLLYKNISANFLSNAWSTLLLLLLTPVYIHFLGLESYGLIGFYLSWVAICGIIDTGISATLTRELAWLSARPNEAIRIPNLLFTLEIIYWGIILILSLAFLSAAWWFGSEWFRSSEISPEIVRDVLMLMALSLAVQIPSGLYVGGLMGLQRQIECSGFLAFFGTIRGLGAVVILWIISSDIRSFILWQILVYTVQTGVLRWLLWKSIGMECNTLSFSKNELSLSKSFITNITFVTALSLLISQVDKIIMSKILPLKEFGFYMLAWTLASGISKISMPIIQAAAPSFTNLISREDSKALVLQFRIICQLMSTLILPPTMLIVFFSKKILFTWTGNPDIAAEASPLLAILVMGMALCASSYPAACILYGKNRIKELIIFNLVALLILIPMWVLIIPSYGVIGFAVSWMLYGLALYAISQFYGIEELVGIKFMTCVFKDFIAPCLTSFFVAISAIYFINSAEGKFPVILLLLLYMIIGWFFALFVCKDLKNLLIRKSKC